MTSSRDYRLRVRDGQGSFYPMNPEESNPGFVAGQRAILAADVPRNAGIEFFIECPPASAKSPRRGWKIDPARANQQESHWEWTPYRQGEMLARLVDTEGSTRSECRLNVEDGRSEVRLHWNHEGEQDGFPLSSDPRVTNCGFSERHKVVFVTNQVSELHLFVDGEKLDKKFGKWEWAPGQYAGEVRAELAELNEKGEAIEEIGGARWVFRLDVSPDPNKIGEGGRVFRRMLRDILDMDPELLIDYEPARFQIGAAGVNDDPLVQLMRLLGKRQEIDRALATIRRNPASVVRPRRRFVPLREVRRADLRTLRSALRNPMALAVIGGNRAPSHTGSGPEPFFDTPATERRLDSPANRAALAMLRTLRLRCKSLPDRLKGLEEGKGGKETRTPLGRRREGWGKTLGDMERRLHAAERQKPFSEVERPEITAAGLNAIAADPLYARFWKVAWAALRKRGDQKQPEAMLPLPPTWEIYESWCFSWLATKLKECLDFEWSPMKRIKVEASKPNCRQLVSKDYSNGTLTLELQSKFAAFKSYWNAPIDAGWSVTSKRFPDIVLRRDGPNPWFILLDAKYSADEIVSRVGDTVHKYQDGLRWGRERGEKCVRPVATLILAPNSDEVKDLEVDGKNVPWLTNPEFVKEHRVGVVALRPDIEPPDWFRSLLTSENPTKWLPSADSQP